MKKFLLVHYKLCASIFFLLIFLPAFGISLFNFLKMYKTENEYIFREAEYITKLTSVRQEQIINEAHNLLFSLSEFPEIKNSVADHNSCSALMSKILEQYKNQGFAAFGVADINGEIICSGAPISQSLNVKYRPYFQELLKTRQFVVGEYVTGSISNKLVLPFAFPVFNSSKEIQAIVFTSKDLSWIRDFNSQISLPKEASLLVFDNNGVISDCLPQTDSCVIGEHSNAPIIKFAIENGNEGRVLAKGTDNISRLYYFIPLSNMQGEGKIYTAIGIDRNFIFSKIISFLVPNIFLLLAVAALSLIVASRECALYNTKCSFENREKISDK